MPGGAPWKPFPHLETERLFLRQLTLDDAETLLTLFSDDAVTRYMDVPSLTHSIQVRQLLRFLSERITALVSIRWGIVYKEHNALVGTCGYNEWVNEHGYRGEIGYDLMRVYWGRGIMSEALRAMLEYGFAHMELNRVQALVTPGNERSMKLLRMLGFQHEGLLRDYGYWKGQFWDQHAWSLLKREWVAQRSTSAAS